MIRIIVSLVKVSGYARSLFALNIELNQISRKLCVSGGQLDHLPLFNKFAKNSAFN